MSKSRVLILEEDKSSQFKVNKACICSLSKADLDNLRLLQEYLPKDLSKMFEDFSEEEKEAIKKYNDFLDTLKQKNKSFNITIDLGLKKIQM